MLLPRRYGALRLSSKTLRDGPPPLHTAHRSLVLLSLRPHTRWQGEPGIDPGQFRVPITSRSATTMSSDYGAHGHRATIVS